MDSEELKMISTVVCYLVNLSLRKWNKIYAFSSNLAPTHELFHSPCLFKIDEVRNRHRFLSFLVSLSQI